LTYVEYLSTFDVHRRPADPVARRTRPSDPEGDTVTAEPHAAPPAESELLDVLVIGAGQAGLAAGHALRDTGLSHLLLEAADAAGGSWSHYYDSLTLFSPARFSALPGLPFPAAPNSYPTRDAMDAYLRGYAEHFALPVRTNARVTTVTWDGAVHTVTLSDDEQLRARALIAASGGFGRPHVPALPGAFAYGGRLLHVADYRGPDPFAGSRVVVVGAGNSAVQVAVELAQVADVSLATRSPVRLRNQTPLGVDVHYWTGWSRLERLPLGRKAAKSIGVLDTGRYAAALAASRPDRREMFTRLTPTGVLWGDGAAEDVDAVILATGYTPDLGYLADLGAAAADGYPHHCHGISLTTPRLGFVGIPGQQGLASATVRGVGADARRVVRALRRQISADEPAPATCRRATAADQALVVAG
jgi:putative flavoprotein involved in K+ transport